MFLFSELLTGLVLLAALGVVLWRRARATGLDRWLPGYLLSCGSRRDPDGDAPIHVFLCIADHYEPKNRRVDDVTASARVRRWVDEYPSQVGWFRDSDGRPPQHTFFYPAELYESELVEDIQRLCRQGYGEIEVHLHHDDDTAENLAEQLATFKELLSTRHGSLSRNRETGELGFVFVHGNWALDNSRADGRHCGVNDELTVLQEAGCYADMTYPSAPSTTQPPTINSIYRAIDDPKSPRSHDYGVPVRAGVPSGEGLLMIQGPLVLDWTSRKFGLLPRIENGCLQGSQPPDFDRLENWLRAGVRVEGRPDWYFVKLHTHGAVEKNADVLLGSPMIELHTQLALRAERSRFQFHYVTAREMVNVIIAAEAGASTWSPELRDFRWLPPSNSHVSRRLQPVAEELSVE